MACLLQTVPCTSTFLFNPVQVEFTLSSYIQVYLSQHFVTSGIVLTVVSAMFVHLSDYIVC